MSVPTVAHDTAIGATGAGRAPHSSRLRRVRRAAVAGAAAATLALGLTPALAQAQSPAVGAISPESVANDALGTLSP